MVISLILVTLQSQITKKQMKNQDPQEEIARLRKALANEKKKNRTVTKQRDKAKADLKEAKAAVKKNFRWSRASVS